MWGVEREADLDALRGRFAGSLATTKPTARRIGCIDPNGLAVRVEVTRKRRST